MKIYDLIIIGAGPAGVLAAKTVISKGLSVLIIEKGLDLVRRRDLTAGWFGRALFTMDFLELEDHCLSNDKTVKEVFRLIQKISSQRNLKIFAEKNQNKFCRMPEKIGKNLAQYLFESISSKADVAFQTEAQLIEEKNGIFIIKTNSGCYHGKNCVIATGKNSIEWIAKLCEFLDLEKKDGGVTLGVRVEVPTFRINEYIEEHGDFIVKGEKAQSTDARVNSFVGEWEDSHIISAYGHTLPDKHSRRTNFMVGFTSTASTSDAIRNIRIINVLANDKVKKERIGDFMENRSILKHIEEFNNLKEVFTEINKLLPLFTNYAIMYVPEVKLKGVLPVENDMKTGIPNLYGAGECTTRVTNLIGAMASGIIAGRTILKEY